MRDDTVEVCRQLARQCSDATAIEKFIGLLFDVFFGSDGKLTATTHKISVLQVHFYLVVVCLPETWTLSLFIYQSIILSIVILLMTYILCL